MLVDFRDTEEERETERNINCLATVCTLTTGGTHNLSAYGWHSNHLSHPARAWTSV